MSSTPTGSFRNSRLFKRYLSDQATYPIFIIIGCAAGLVAFAGSRTLFAHPDVYLSKSSRSSTIRDNLEQGTSHSTNWIRDMAKSKSDDDAVAIFPSLNKALLGRHINPSAKEHDYEDEDE